MNGHGVSDVETRLKALMVSSLDGDAQAYRSLLSDVGAHLRAYYARRLSSGADVEDLVQETLIAMHTRRATYDPAQQLTPWLHAIARYKLIDHFRRSGRRPTIPLDAAGELTSHADHEDALARRDVEQLIAKLPRRTQALVRSVKFEGLSTAEAAARSGMSESAVKVAVHRALRSLSAMLRREEGR
jgi:RNA polymerase sigma-70 factor, ECF subfamily